MPRRTPSSTPGLFDEPASAPAPASVPAPAGPRPYTVGQLTSEIQARVGGIGRVRVEGELSRFKPHGSGHVYFDLKDEGAKLSCVIWKGQRARAVKFAADEGMQVVATGKLDVYAPRGSYSLIVERLEPIGVGALLAQLEQLKDELKKLGRFDRRRPLPARPRMVGVVTSRDGAALTDFLRTRSMRWPAYPVRLCHTPVQGPGAALEIAHAIERLDASGVDVIVVCRGGGSIEDLWAFNERPVAEAVWACTVPVISGVGHESDTTLIDLVADHRAHTPTDAAQTVIPDRRALLEELERRGGYLMEAANRAVEERVERLRRLTERPTLRSADWILGRRSEQLRLCGSELVRLIERRLRAPVDRLGSLQMRLERRSPRRELDRRAERIHSVGQRLEAAGGRNWERADARLRLLARTLEATSPLAVLGRGYSLTRKKGSEDPVRSIAALAQGDEIESLLAHGSVLSQVLETREPMGNE